MMNIFKNFRSGKMDYAVMSDLRAGKLLYTSYTYYLNIPGNVNYFTTKLFLNHIIIKL